MNDVVKVSRSGGDMYAHLSNGRKRLWTGTTSKRKVLEAESVLARYQRRELTGDQYADELERIFGHEAKRKAQDAAYQEECAERLRRNPNYYAVMGYGS